MEITKFKIKDRTITQENNIRLTGIVGQDKFQVNFVDEEWEGLHKTLKLIRSDGNVVYLALINDEVELTQECYVEGNAQLGFFGTINENDPESMKIASTNYIPIYFGHHAYSTNSQEAINIPTPTQWDIIIGQMNDVLDATIQAKEDTQAIKEDVEEIQLDIAQKANDFNTNYTQKLNDFNTNAENKTDAFNSNATSKTNTFNSNATTKTNQFNTNATNKTNTFNDNYTNKVGKVNQIIDDFKDYVETVDYNYNNLENKPQTWNALTGDVD